jgi:hypothetical protein
MAVTVPRGACQPRGSLSVVKLDHHTVFRQSVDRNRSSATIYTQGSLYIFASRMQRDQAPPTIWLIVPRHQKGNSNQ